MNRKMHRIIMVAAAAGMLWLTLSAAGAEQTPAGGAGMDAVDVLHLVDGSEVVGKLTAFDGAKFTVEVQGEARQIPRAEVVRIAFGQPQPRPKLLYVGSDTDDLANTFVAEALERAGFDLTPATRLPAALEGFDVVVLESVSASSPEAAKMLRSFVGKGGGAVLVGNVPKALAGQEQRGFIGNKPDVSPVTDWVGGFALLTWSMQPPLADNTIDVSPVADWVGGSRMDDGDEQQDPRCTAAFTNPFFACPDITVGQELFVFRGERPVNFFATGSLSAQARPVAKIKYERGNREETHVAAFAHPFGQGRTYYQFMSYEPNHPKLVDLLVAAAKWVAGVLPEVGG